jgi:hypothetical protein
MDCPVKSDSRLARGHQSRRRRHSPRHRGDGATGRPAAIHAGSTTRTSSASIARMSASTWRSPANCTCQGAARSGGGQSLCERILTG